MPRFKTVFTWGAPAFGQPQTVKVEQRQNKAALLRVTYGLQVKDGLTYAQAARELGECIFHALACDSILNNEGE